MQRFLLGSYVEIPRYESDELIARAASFLRTTSAALNTLVPGNHPAFGHLTRAEHYMELKDALGVFGAAACARAAAYQNNPQLQDADPNTEAGADRLRSYARQCMDQARSELQGALL